MGIATVQKTNSTKNVTIGAQATNATINGTMSNKASIVEEPKQIENVTIPPATPPPARKLE